MHIAYWIALILLALIGGQLERRQRRCPRANLSQSASQGKTFLFWAKCQTIAFLVVLGMFVLAFLLFTWKMGLLAMMVWFVAHHVFANKLPPNRASSPRRAAPDHGKPD